MDSPDCLLLFLSNEHICFLLFVIHCESFASRGLCNHRRTFVCPAVCLFVCYHDN